MEKYTFDDLVRMGPFSAIELIMDMTEDEKRQILNTMSFKHHTAVVESEDSRIFFERNQSLKKLLENAS